MQIPWGRSSKTFTPSVGSLGTKYTTMNMWSRGYTGEDTSFKYTLENRMFGGQARIMQGPSPH